MLLTTAWLLKLKKVGVSFWLCVTGDTLWIFAAGVWLWTK